MRTTFRRHLGRLLQLLQLELEVVTTALLRSERQTLGVPGVLRACRVRIDGSERLARGVCRRTRAGDRRRQLGQLALASQDAVQFAVGSKKVDGLRRNEMALRRDKCLAHTERVALAQGFGDIGAAAHAAQPVGKQSAEAVFHRANLGQQRIAARGFGIPGSAWRVQGDASWRCAGVSAFEPGSDDVEARKLDGIETFA